MKISKWILLASLLGSYAQAQIPQVFERQRVKIQIYRNTIVKESDDTFTSVRTDLCKEVVDIDVFDLRNSSGTFVPPHTNCKFEFNHVQYSINLLFMSAIDRSDFDGTKPLTDVKTFMAWINPENWNTSQSLPIPTITLSAATKDLETKSMILHFRPNQMVLCLSQNVPPVQPPQPIPNRFKVAAKSKDDCQVLNPDAVGATVEFETLP